MLDVKTPKTECKGFHCTGKMAIKKTLQGKREFCENVQNTGNSYSGLGKDDTWTVRCILNLVTYRFWPCLLTDFGHTHD